MGVWPCGIITLIGGLFIAEAKTQVYGFLHSIIDRNREELSSLCRFESPFYCRSTIHLHIEYICYDDGCHLRRFAQNPARCNVTETAKMIAQLKIVIDRMHFQRHVDDWCRRNCNPNSFSDLEHVS